MSFAKCEIGKMSCDYVEAIHSSRHMLWPIWLHTLNVIWTRRISSNEKEENELIIYASCLWLSWNIFKTWRQFIYINITKNYQHKLIEDTKGCVNDDGDWRRINKGLTVMNHTSDKNTRESWRQGTGCDGEGQMNIWAQDINHAMKSHIALSIDIYELRNQCDMDKKKSIDCIS
jgi:hypothetical protein